MRRRLYSFGPFQLDIGEQVLLRDGHSLQLKPKVFSVLAVLVENSGRVVSKDELMKLVWADSFVEEGNLAVSIFEIRKTLGESQNGHRYIETVPRRGYRFVAPVADPSKQRESEKSSQNLTPRLLTTSGGYAATTKGSIAVLPFRFIGSTGNKYLGLGMADALITRLSNLRQVIVRPTSAVHKYTGGHDPVLVGRELGVEWVLDGSIQKTRNRIRVTVQLLNAPNGVLLWGDKFDEKFTEVFAVEDSISEQVATALAPRLTGEEKKLLAKRYTQDPRAYEAYLRGRFFLEKRTIEGCRRAIEFFEEAIGIDSAYALAYTGIAGCYITLNTICPSRECNASAEKAALSALDIDSSLSEAHASLGYVKTRQWDWLSAEIEFKSAIALNPNYATAHAFYAIYLAEVGRSAEALAEINAALSLDPLSLIINSQLGSILYVARRYREAAEQFRKTLELDAAFAVAHFILGYVLEALGEYEDAISEYRHSQGSLGNIAEYTACVGRVHALSGRTAQALQALEELKRLSVTSYVQTSLFVLIHVALGNKEEAFKCLEQAYSERDEDLCLLKVDPRLDSLREDPRFVSLLERVGLAGGTISP